MSEKKPNLKITLVVPAYNEERSIAQTILSAKSYTGNQVDVIVANDCSKDHTAQRAADAGAIVHTLPHNQGYDGALRAGIELAHAKGYDFAITFDADGQHPAHMLPKYIELLPDHDLVLGIRPETARFSEFVFAIYTRCRYGIRDPLCGMKAYRLSVLEQYKFDTYDSTNTELMLRIVKAKRPWTQLAVPIAPREGGPSRFGSVWRGNMRIFKSLWRAIIHGL